MRKSVIMIGVLVVGVLGSLMIFNNLAKKPITFEEKLSGYTTPITQSWYTSLFFDQYSKPLFALPLYYKLTPDGIEIGKPAINYSARAIVGSHAPDILLKAKITSKIVTYAGEWDVKILAKTSDVGDLNIHLIKGSPTIYFKAEKDILPTMTNKNYVFSKGSGSEFSSITLMPDDAKAVDTITACAKTQPEGTVYDFSFNDIAHKLTITNSFGNNKSNKYLTTIWPHQMASLNGNYEVLGSYETVRGKLNLICTNNFSFNLTTFDIPTKWSDVFDKNKLADKSAVDLFRKDMADFNKTTYPTGVYFKGKYVKNLLDLVEIGESLKLTADAADLKTKLKKILLSEIENFRWDEKTGLVMSKNPEFGNEKGNDHHFQYGYYIYTYAKMYDSFSKAEQNKIKTLIDLFLREGMPGINTTDSTRKLRFLDAAESHSWADGQALFEDGNNQESTSEALQYWYGWYIWGKMINDKKIADWGRFAYFSELAGRNTYWFLVNNQALRSKFNLPILSLIWGGKEDYATWFSADEDKIFGIQIIPPLPVDSLAFKLPVEDANRITTYYDRLFGENVGATRSFGGYYLYFKKINGFDIKNYENIDETEFVPRSLLFLLHML